MTAGRPPRVLLVDDSQASRAAVARILEEACGARIVGTAGDGEEALREALRLLPDVIFLDLQMPRMDGFTFLRLLMARQPLPVVVVSSQAQRHEVFRALELGALDFVAKPEGGASYDTIRETLVEKCQLLRSLRVENLPGRARPGTEGRTRVSVGIEPLGLVAIGASTGGPRAIQRLLAALPNGLPLGILVAQHMPERFTAAFAERLARTTPFSALEASAGEVVASGRVLVAPGGQHLEVRRDGGGVLRAVIEPPTRAAREVRPSADRLFASLARAAGPRACAVVLTGMGNDGSAGVAAIKGRGGLTLAESQDTAVVYGMPQAAAEGGAVDEVLPLDAIADRIARFVEGLRGR